MASDTLVLILLKVGGLFLFLVLTLFGLSVPFFLGRLKGRATILSLANSFSGGVFLGAGLCHMLADATEEFNEAFSSSVNDYPIIPLVCGGTIMAFMLLDNVVFGGGHGHGIALVAKMKNEGSEAYREEHLRIHTHDQGRRRSSSSQPLHHGRLKEFRRAHTHDHESHAHRHIPGRKSDAESDCSCESCSTCIEELETGRAGELFESTFVEEVAFSDEPPQTEAEHSIAVTESEGDSRARPSDPVVAVNGSVPEMEANIDEEAPSSTVGGPSSPKVIQKKKGKRGFRHSNKGMLAAMLAIMLSIHSFVTGVAFGVQEDVDEALVIFITVIAHKSVEAFALGTNIVKAELGFISFVSFTLPYAFMTPVGVAIGLAIASILSGDWATLVTSLFTGIASGTFIYVGLIECIVEEFHHPPHAKIAVWQWFCVLVGFTLFALLAIWA